MTSKNYIPEIDGLRALAVMSVFVFHLNAHYLPGGFTGVDVFFVISGYVVTLAAARYAGDGGYLAFLREFYTRRIARIMPALLLMLGVTGALSWMFIPSAWLSQNEAETGLSAIAGLSNFVLLLSRDAYFDPSVEYNPFTHTWSLAVEEQFYLLFPAIFLLWWQRRAGAKHRPARRVVPILSVASLVYCAQASYHSPQVAFYMMPARFWELGLGMMLAQWQLAGAPVPGNRHGELVTIGLSLGVFLIALGFVIVSENQFPFPGALLPVAGTGLVLAALSLPGTSGSSFSVARMLRLPIIVYVGKISYSLYLWHWPVIVLVRWTIGIENIAGFVIAVIAPFLLATASYHLVETPLRRWMRMPVKSFGLGALLATTTGAAMVLGYSNSNAVSLSVVSDRSNWYVDAPSRASPSDGPFNDRTVWMVGDSHAIAYRDTLWKASRQLGFGYRVIHNRCRLGKIVGVPRTDDGCMKRTAADLSLIETSAKAGDVLVLASLRVPRYIDQWGAVESHSDEELVSDEGIAQVVEIVTKMREMDVTVIIDLPKPVFRAPPFRCADWFNRSNPVCAAGFEMARSEIEAMREPVVTAIRSIAARHANVVVWDPLPELCGQDTCSAIDSDGVPNFFDADHLSGAGSAHLARSLAVLLRSAFETAAG